MPKLENFPTFFKINNHRFQGNSLDFNTNGDIVSVYYSQTPQVLLYEGAYSVWTDSTDTPYASLQLLTDDLESFVLSVRPSNYYYEVALGRIQGSMLWNKFGYNSDVDVGTEVVASFGGTFVPMTTARTLSIVSTDATDDSGNTGANSIIVYGINASRESQTVVVIMNGTTPVVTTETWLGVNRISIYISGTNKVNAGTITATATTDLTIQGQIPIANGTSQQCIFFTQVNSQTLIEYVSTNIVRFGSGTEPFVTMKLWVYSAVSNSKYEIARETIDASIRGAWDFEPKVPLPVGESSVIWLEATSTRADTQVNGRFSLIETRDVDA